MRVASIEHYSFRWLFRLLLVLILLMPFHAFFTTWLGTAIGYRPLWQIWKELIIAIMSGASLLLMYRDKKLLHFITSYRPNRVIAALIALHLILLVGLRPELEPAVMALKLNLEFLVLFVIAQVVTYSIKTEYVEQRLSQVILIAAAGVGMFALAQVFLLPTDFLTNFGYGSTTILPYLSLQNSEKVRILATLGGPNQLGAYLLLPVSLIVAKVKFQPQNWLLGLLLIPLLLASFNTYSRSAWLGLATALTVLLVLLLKRKLIVAAVGATAILGFLIVLMLSGNSTKFLGERAASSDTAHILAIEDGLEKAKQQPWGYGPGTAGPASIRAEETTISENYYLQLTLEIGLIGLALFIILSLDIAQDLWRKAANSPLRTALLASFIGMAVINLFLHGWTDSTIAIVWWGAAGAIIRK